MFKKKCIFYVIFIRKSLDGEDTIQERRNEIKVIEEPTEERGEKNFQHNSKGSLKQ